MCGGDLQQDVEGEERMRWCEQSGCEWKNNVKK